MSLSTGRHGNPGTMEGGGGGGISMDDLQGRVPLNKNLGLAEGSVYIEEVWESSASEAGNSGM